MSSCERFPVFFLLLAHSLGTAGIYYEFCTGAVRYPPVAGARWHQHPMQKVYDFQLEALKLFPRPPVAASVMRLHWATRAREKENISRDRNPFVRNIPLHPVHPFGALRRAHTCRRSQQAARLISSDVEKCSRAIKTRIFPPFLSLITLFVSKRAAESSTRTVENSSSSRSDKDGKKWKIISIKINKQNAN